MGGETFSWKWLIPFAAHSRSTLVLEHEICFDFLAKTKVHELLDSMSVTTSRVSQLDLNPPPSDQESNIDQTEDIA